jgi:DNA-nicking Smr family endonuclease
MLAEGRGGFPFTDMPKRPHKPENAPEDADLFQKEMAGVKPLQHKQAPIKSARKMPPDSPKRNQTDGSSENPDVLRFMRPGLQATVLKKLRRGQFPIEATLDLHGYTAAEADLKLRRFIQHAHACGLRAVRIVHGKGRGSADAPVLKSRVDRWLRDSSTVLAFCSAQPRNGGTGAVDVLLRK